MPGRGGRGVKDEKERERNVYVIYVSFEGCNRKKSPVRSSLSTI